MFLIYREQDIALNKNSKALCVNSHRGSSTHQEPWAYKFLSCPLTLHGKWRVNWVLDVKYEALTWINSFKSSSVVLPCISNVDVTILWNRYINGYNRPFTGGNTSYLKTSNFSCFLLTSWKIYVVFATVCTHLYSLRTVTIQTIKKQK